MTYDILLCCRSESIVMEKLLKEKEQIITELMDEGMLLLEINVSDSQEDSTLLVSFKSNGTFMP